jgi:hypothetical protein
MDSFGRIVCPGKWLEDGYTKNDVYKIGPELSNSRTVEAISARLKSSQNFGEKQHAGATPGKRNTPPGISSKVSFVQAHLQFSGFCLSHSAARL